MTMSRLGNCAALACASLIFAAGMDPLRRQVKSAANSTKSATGAVIELSMQSIISWSARANAIVD
jgi:hypothetical protein